MNKIWSDTDMWLAIKKYCFSRYSRSVCLMVMAHTCPHKIYVEVLPPGISKHVFFDNTVITDLTSSDEVMR